MWPLDKRMTSIPFLYDDFLSICILVKKLPKKNFERLLEGLTPKSLIFDVCFAISCVSLHGRATYSNYTTNL